MICYVENIANDGEAFWARWEITEGSPRKSGHEPEDKADKGSQNKEVNRAVAASHRHPNKTSDSRKVGEKSEHSL